MKIARILVPTDFSPHAEHALDTAIALAKPGRAAIHLLHVFQLPVALPTPDSATIPLQFWDEIRRQGAAHLAKSRQKVEAAGLSCETEMIEDVPGFAVAPAAQRARADLIVMGSRGLSGLKHLVLGSVAERTVRAARCPVLTVKADDSVAGRFATIVVPIDFSASSDAALAQAKSLCLENGPAHLVLVHAYYVPVELEQYLATRDTGLFDSISRTVTQDLEKLLTRLKAEGVSAEYYAQPGRPESVIVELAREKRADLIAMGTHGRRGISHLLLGSVAEHVVRTAQCPVLTVREPEKPK
jgi:nucleotide-binding universal stress UspA family protein